MEKSSQRGTKQQFLNDLTVNECVRYRNYPEDK